MKSEEYRLEKERDRDSSMVLGVSLARGRWSWYKVKRSKRVCMPDSYVNGGGSSGWRLREVPRTTSVGNTGY